MSVIEIKNVTKRFKGYADRAVTLKEKVLFRKRRKYKEREVLKNVSLSIDKGEVVGLIGENGSGKSTLLKLMTGILYPEQGEINIDGRVSSLLELGAGFHPDMSGRDNVYTNAAIFGLSKKETDERFQEILDFSELHEFIDNPVRTYSSGMYMRLAFSVAINVDADVLLIDEILAVGDTNFQDKCFKKLEQLKQGGTTIVLVTHDINVIEEFCHRAVWINNGRIAKDGERYAVAEAYMGYMNEKRATLFDNGKDFDKEDVYYAYGFLLGRLPDSSDVATECCNIYNDMQELVDTIIQSEEYASKKEDMDRAGMSDEEVKREFEVYRYNERKNNEETVEEERATDAVIGEAENRHRFGNGKVIIADAKIMQPGQSDEMTVEGGKDVEFVIQYEVNEDADSYIFGLAVTTVDNLACFGVSTLRDAIQIDSLNRQGEVRCRVKDMNLAAGEYKLTLRITDSKGVPFDYIRDYKTFYVMSGEKTDGVMTAKHDWNIL